METQAESKARVIVEADNIWNGRRVRLVREGRHDFWVEHANASGSWSGKRTRPRPGYALDSLLEAQFESACDDGEITSMIVERLRQIGCGHGENAHRGTPPMFYDDWISCAVAHHRNLAKAEAEKAAADRALDAEALLEEAERIVARLITECGSGTAKGRALDLIPKHAWDETNRLLQRLRARKQGEQ